MEYFTEHMGLEGLTGKIALSAISDCRISAKHNNWDSWRLEKQTNNLQLTCLFEWKEILAGCIMKGQ